MQVLFTVVHVQTHIANISRMFHGRIAAKLGNVLSQIQTTGTMECVDRLKAECPEKEEEVVAPADVDKRSQQVEVERSGGQIATWCGDHEIVGNEVAVTAGDQNLGSQPTAPFPATNGANDREHMDAYAERIVATGSADGLGVMLATCPLTASRALNNLGRVEGEKPPKMAPTPLSTLTTQERPPQMAPTPLSTLTTQERPPEMAPTPLPTLTTQERPPEMAPTPLSTFTTQERPPEMAPTPLSTFTTQERPPEMAPTPLPTLTSLIKKAFTPMPRCTTQSAMQVSNRWEVPLDQRTLLNSAFPFLFILSFFLVHAFEFQTIFAFDPNISQRFGSWLLEECDGTSNKALQTLRCLHALCGMAPEKSLRPLLQVRSSRTLTL